MTNTGKNSGSPVVDTRDASDSSLTSPRTDLRDLKSCVREFSTHTSPRMIAVAISVMLVLRAYLGNFSWRDIAVLLLLVALQPFVEWFIHKYLLHLKPFEVRGRQIDLISSSEHRKHHMDPSDLDQGVLSWWSVAIFLPMIAVTVTVVSVALHPLLGGDLTLLITTGILGSYILLGYYEWMHFLIHTPYVPKTAIYRSIWRSHRLHHFKHEDYWLGVTSNLGDRALGTFPDKDDVPRSPTARTLGVDM
ncbi:MAG: sterol desaturase family protein [Thermoleophilaceae bacterium]|nr:sterol desaturase family protein [Thermoleophilaceae bacterium]